MEEGDPVVNYLSRCPFPCLLLLQSVPLPFLSPAPKIDCEVPDVEGPVVHKHFSLGAPGVGSVTLLQDHNFVPHMTVHKVNLEIVPV